MSTRLGERILKVDHAGEHGAVNIYRAQILVVLRHLLEQRRQLETADPDAFDTVSRIIAEEQEHHDHGHDAMQAGAFWPPILTPVVRASTEAVIWLGMRL